MIHTFLEVLHFIKNPIYQKDGNTNLKYRLLKFVHLLGISLFTSILILIPISFILKLSGLENIEHDMDKLFQDKSIAYILLMVAVIAPIFEELIFRAPLALFKNKTYFKYAFWGSAITFGLIHIMNYEINTTVLLLAPLLIAPQTILGGYFGFIRIKFGLRWSMLLHACYNLILTVPALLFES